MCRLGRQIAKNLLLCGMRYRCDWIDRRMLKNARFYTAHFFWHIFWSVYAFLCIYLFVFVVPNGFVLLCNACLR